MKGVHSSSFICTGNAALEMATIESFTPLKYSIDAEFPYHNLYPCWILPSPTASITATPLGCVTSPETAWGLHSRLSPVPVASFRPPEEAGAGEFLKALDILQCYSSMLLNAVGIPTPGASNFMTHIPADMRISSFHMGARIRSYHAVSSPDARVQSLCHTCSTLYFVKKHF